MGSPPAEDVRVVGGRYRLLHQLGRGAMGPTWQAEDDLLERSVAIKQVVLPRRSRDRAELHDRILREARAAALLVHRHAVTVLDVFEDDGQPWIVTELLAGAESLAVLIARNGPLPAPRVAEIGKAVLGALDAAHARGIVHRDVRPGNVLLAGTRIVLSDLGTPALEGDPAYTAPQRAEDGPATPAADLWSLGATLHFAVQGQPPSDGEPAERAGATLAALLTGLLNCDPERRLDAARASTLLANAVEVLPEERATPLASPAAPPPPVVVPAANGAALTQFTSEAGWRVAIPGGWRCDRLGGGDYTFADVSGAVTITIRTARDTGADPLAALKTRLATVQPPGVQAHYLDAVPYRGLRAADYDHTHHTGNGRAVRTRSRSFVAGARTYEISVTAPADRWAEGGPCFAGATDTFVPAG